MRTPPDRVLEDETKKMERFASRASETGNGVAVLSTVALAQADANGAPPAYVTTTARHAVAAVAELGSFGVSARPV